MTDHDANSRHICTVLYYRIRRLHRNQENPGINIEQFAREMQLSPLRVHAAIESDDRLWLQTFADGTKIARMKK